MNQLVKKLKAKLLFGIAATLSLGVATTLLTLPKPASANTLPVEWVSGNLEADTNWSADRVYIVNASFNIPAGVTLTIPAGTIVKTINGGIEVYEGGTLQVNGTSGNPVVFTSYHDDSVGGDSNNNGPSTGGAGDYWYAVQHKGGSVNLAHSIIRGAAYDGVNVRCDLGQGTVTIVDSNFESTLWIAGCASSKVTLLRNNFSVTGRFPIKIDSSAANILVLDGPNKNNFTGVDKSLVADLSYAFVPAGESWKVDVSSGIKVLHIFSGLSVKGNLTVGAGIALKTMQNATSVIVEANGSAQFEGTTTDLVVFTSYMDDTVGGNTDTYDWTPYAGTYDKALKVLAGGSVNANHIRVKYPFYILEAQGSVEINNSILDEAAIGIAVTGSANLELNDTVISNVYNTAIEATDQVKAIMTGVTISNVQRGLSVSSQATVTFRGSFNNIQERAISACNWGEDCNVDATYTNWGSVDGPFTGMSNSEWMACGAVQTLPWKHGGNTYDGGSPLGIVQNCSGANPYTNLSNAGSNFNYRVGQKGMDCDNGMQDACDAIATAMTCFAGAVNVAGSLSPIPLPEIDENWQVGSFQDAVIDAGMSKMRDETIMGGITSTSAAAYKGMIGSLFDTFLALESAYNTCAP